MQVYARRDSTTHFGDKPSFTLSPPTTARKLRCVSPDDLTACAPSLLTLTVSSTPLLFPVELKIAPISRR
jgi:hypothetical protein